MERLVLQPAGLTAQCGRKEGEKALSGGFAFLCKGWKHR